MKRSRCADGLELVSRVMFACEDASMVVPALDTVTVYSSLVVRRCHTDDTTKGCSLTAGPANDNAVGQYEDGKSILSRLQRYMYSAAAGSRYRQMQSIQTYDCCKVAKDTQPPSCQITCQAAIYPGKLNTVFEACKDTRTSLSLLMLAETVNSFAPTF